MNTSRYCVRLKRGFTLIEILIVIAMVAILGSIAYPSYQESVRRGQRAECAAALHEAMQAQEREYTRNRAYTTTLSKNYSGDKGAAASACALSAVACGNGIATCVQVIATTNRKDPKCAQMTLDSTNTRTAADKAKTDQLDNCWK